MSNGKNLKIIRSMDEAREKGRKGGIKSGENRRKRKAMKEQLETILSLPVTLKDNKGNSLLDRYKEMGINENEINNQMAISIELFLTAMGNSKSKIQAIKTIREITKDEETSKEDKEIRVMIINDIPENEEEECKNDEGKIL